MFVPFWDIFGMRSLLIVVLQLQSRCERNKNNYLVKPFPFSKKKRRKKRQTRSKNSKPEISLIRVIKGCQRRPPSAYSQAYTPPRKCALTLQQLLEIPCSILLQAQLPGHKKERKSSNWEDRIRLIRNLDRASAKSNLRTKLIEPIKILPRSISFIIASFLVYYSVDLCTDLFIDFSTELKKINYPVITDLPSEFLVILFFVFFSTPIQLGRFLINLGTWIVWRVLFLHEMDDGINVMTSFVVSPGEIARNTVG